MNMNGNATCNASCNMNMNGNRATNRNQNANAAAAMSHVYMHGFVCDDAALFLDTHPDCPHARRLYQENFAQYEHAAKHAAAAGSPLFRAYAVSDCGWSWTDEPWPWEGGSC